LYRLYYAHVAGAATQVSCNRGTDLGFSRRWVFVEKGFGGEQHSWYAETTLHGAFLDESLL
jgi:hypothetical protein